MKSYRIRPTHEEGQYGEEQAGNVIIQSNFREIQNFPSANLQHEICGLAQN